MLEERKMAPRLTQHEAWMNNQLLGISYKTDGRRITKRTAMREIAKDRTQISHFVQHYTSGLDSLELRSGSSEIKAVKADLDKIVIALNRAESIRHSINESEMLQNEPISKVNFPGGKGPANMDIWQPYQAWATQGLLHIDSKRANVRSISWRTEDLCDVHLENFPLKYTVRPLKPVNALGRDDEIRVGDIALLAGHFMVIAEPADIPNTHGFSMTNYLRIVDVEEQAGTRRGRNKMATATGAQDSVFI
jgi:hypothetical protein